MNVKLEGLTNNKKTYDLIKKIESGSASKRQRSAVNLAYDKTRLSAEWGSTPISIEFNFKSAN